MYDEPRRGLAPIERITRPFSEFIDNRIGGAVLLLLATVLALVLANTAAEDAYFSLLSRHITVGYGELSLSKPLLLWINDGLMGVFFFLVGLEIKREILVGELSSVRNAALPAIAAVGGMAVPALLFFALNREGPGAAGWGIPMATDIAFALGILALAGKRVPIGLTVFLTALAIVDDIGAILVIAVFYTDQIVLTSLLLGGLLLAIAIGMNAIGVRSAVAFFIVGTLVWLSFLKSGVHATLAAVVMAMTIPARTRINTSLFLQRMRALMASLSSAPSSTGLRMPTEEEHDVFLEMASELDRATSPVMRLEHVLLPISTFFVLPAFALANAGVDIGAGFFDALSHRVSLGIIVGLFVGKQLGVFAFSFLAVRLGVARLPSGVGWRQVHAVALLAGVGFTMSLFIDRLAFADPGLEDVAKVGILSASLLSGVIGFAALKSALPAAPAPPEA